MATTPGPKDAPHRLDGPADHTAVVGSAWRVPAWALAPAVAAPLLLLAGIFVAPKLQPPGYDSVRDTMSALAALDAASRNVMTVSFVGLGLSYVLTAVGLVGAGVLGRVLLACGGIGTALVAVFPLPTGTGGSPAHAMSALLALLGSTLWPLGLMRRSRPPRGHHPFPARAAIAGSATAALLLLVTWFALEEWVRWGHVGLSERVAAFGQSLWPLIVVLTARPTRRTGRRAGRGERKPDRPQVTDITVTAG